MTFLDILFFVFNIALLGGISYFLYQRVKGYYLGPFFLPCLGLKLMASVAVGLIYRHYYLSGDTFAFYKEAVDLVNIAYSDPIAYLKILFVNDIPNEFKEVLNLRLQPRAFFTAKMASIVNIFTYNNYWISGLYFSYFSYLGMWYLANMLASKFVSTRYFAAFAFLIFPSVVFWSSGLNKESLVMGCLSFIIAFSVPYLILSKNIEVYKVVLITLFFWILLKLKYYYVGVLIPVMLANFIVAYLRFNFKFVQRNYYTHFGSWLAVFILILAFATTIHPNLNFGTFMDRMVETHNLIYESSSPEDLIAYNKLSPTAGSILSNLPLALYSGLYRPALTDANTMFQYYVGFENLLLMILSLGAIVGLFRKPKFPHRILIFSVVVYIVILATFMALSSPNFGTLVRYKIAFLPFFVYLLLVNNPIINKLFGRFLPQDEELAEEEHVYVTFPDAD